MGKLTAHSYHSEGCKEHRFVREASRNLSGERLKGERHQKGQILTSRSTGSTNFLAIMRQSQRLPRGQVWSRDSLATPITIANSQVYSNVRQQR
jgi:hypothetical protein